MTAVAKNLPNVGGNKLFDGMLAPMVKFQYQGNTYELWVAKEENTVKVKLAQVVSGVPKFQSVLTVNNFASGATANITALTSKASDLARLSVAPLPKSKNPPKPPPANLAAMQVLQTQVVALEQVAEKNIQAGQCTTLNACFPAGAKLWTPTGFRNVEDIQAGEYVYARNEFDPNGAIEPKLVEQKFVRTGRVLELWLSDENLIPHHSRTPLPRIQ